MHLYLLLRTGHFVLQKFVGNVTKVHLNVRYGSMELNVNYKKYYTCLSPWQRRSSVVISELGARRYELASE